MSCAKCLYRLLLLLAFATDAPCAPDGFPAVAQINISSATSSSPRLTVGYQDGEITLQWPALIVAWVLEQSSELSPLSSWTYVPLEDTSATNISITVTPGAGNIFYRLRKLNPPGLTGQWKFDEADGPALADSSGHGNDGLLTNVVRAGGRVGTGALWFNGGAVDAGGSRAWISNDNYHVLPPQGGAFSISLWFNPDSLATGWRGLIGTDTDGNNGWHVALHNLGPGSNELAFASSGANALNLTGRKLLLPGRWYELTATYDGSEAAIYVDSELLVRGNGEVLANDGPLYVGGGIANYDSFLGLIDELRVYTNALTSEEISLAGRWDMNENGGTLVSDSSLGGHHASVSSSTAWISGRSGAGLNVNNNTLTIPNESSDVLPPTGGSFSVSLWIYPNSVPLGWSGLMSCADGTNTGWSVALDAKADGQRAIHFWSTNSDGTLDLYAPVNLTNGVWSKLDLTFNGGIATLYVNGRKVKSSSGGIQGNSAPLIVGAVAGMPNFNGLIDELKIYRRERGEEEIGPVAKVMWETVLINNASNLVLQGFGPSTKALSYSIVDTISPTKGTLMHAAGSPVVTYTAGPNKGPDAFTYAVSDGEFTSEPATVVVSVVQPHWLSPEGGTVAPLDGSDADHAWLAGPADACDAILKTNRYYDCFYYAPGEYQTRGWKFETRGTANPGCKHIGSGTEGANQTVLKLVDTWDAWSEGLIFQNVNKGFPSDGFEVHDMVLDCNAANNPKYALGEPVWIVIPLANTARVDTVTLRWSNHQISTTARQPNGRYWWQVGRAQQFDIGTRSIGTNGTNWTTVSSTGVVDVVAVGVVTDEIILQLKRRDAGVDFYGLTEVYVDGASVSLPSAEIAGVGTESRLSTNNADHSILHIADGNVSTVWASGPEDQVQITIPIDQSIPITQLEVRWNCHAIAGVGKLGPASDYQIQARDPDTGLYNDVSFVPQPRSPTGVELVSLSTPVLSDQLMLRLKTREVGVDFYSLREIRLLNGSGAVPMKVPTALNMLAWDNYYEVLRAFDGDANTEWASNTQGMIGAIDVVGNNLKFTGLKIIGFGTKAAKECFAMFIQPPPAVNTGPASFGNVLVRDCVFAEPAHDNADVVTVLNTEGTYPRSLTNVSVRNCSISDLKPWFPVSQAFMAIDIENCFASNCGVAVYFEPFAGQDDSVGPVLIRSNRFVNVDSGVRLAFHSGAPFDRVTMIENEIILTGAGGAGFSACDLCDPGPSGWITNVTALNNVVRYPDWVERPATADFGLFCSDIRNATFGNNVVVLGGANALRLRHCPAGYIPPPFQPETCDFIPPPPPPPATNAVCLDTLPLGYRRSWFNNRDLSGNLLNVRFISNGSDGLASQQQWP